MSTGSRLGRGFPVLLAALAVPGVLIALASPAAAATGTITSPTKGSTRTLDTPFDISAKLSRSGLFDTATAVLYLTPPGEGQREIDRTSSGSDVDLRYAFDPRDFGGKPARNGQYTMTLVSNSSTLDSGTFTLQLPPRAPAQVDASATGEHQITITWRASTEPDLLSYDVYQRFGEAYDVIASNLDKTTTAFVVNLPSSGYSGDYNFAVRSRRCADPSCAETLDSPVAPAPTVTLSEPAPEPEPEPTSSPGSGGGYGEPTPDSNGNGKGNGKGKDSGTGTDTGSGTGSGTASPASDPYAAGNTSGDYSSGKKPAPAAAQRLAFGLNFKNFAPKLGAPKLPPLPKYAPAPIPEGTYNPSLPYGTQTVEETETVAQPGGAQQIFEDLVSTVFEGARLWRSVAWAMILLLAAAHLRLWLRTSPTD